MRVRGRVDRLRRAVGGVPPGQLDLIVAVPLGCGMADDLPVGVHFNADRRVALVVFDGAGPHRAVLAGFEDRLTPIGMLIISAPDFAT